MCRGSPFSLLITENIILQKNVYHHLVSYTVSPHIGFRITFLPLCRYRLPLLVADPAQGSDQLHGPAIHVVFFGPRAEEIIGSPVDALINDGTGIGSFVPTRIASLYGKHFNLQVTVSSMSMQNADISYQVDAILGVPNIQLHLPAPGSSCPAPGSSCMYFADTTFCS